MSQYLLIDGNNLMFASQLANSKLTAGDVETTAIFGLLGQLRRLAERFPGSKKIVLWDRSPTWRHREFPSYKSGRDKNPQIVKAKEALKQQRKIAMMILPLIGIEQFEADGYEADDLAGHFARGLASKGAQIILVTNDHDWLQLVSAQVSWFDPRTDGGNLVTDVLFESFTGFDSPQKFLEAKCLQGDTSDTISGVGGLGEGAAKAIFEQFESVDDMVLNWDKPVAGAPLSRYRKKISAFVAPGSEGLRIFVRNMRLMNLRDVQIRAPIERAPASRNLDTFKRALHKLAFTSIAVDLDRWFAPFL